MGLHLFKKKSVFGKMNQFPRLLIVNNVLCEFYAISFHRDSFLDFYSDHTRRVNQDVYETDCRGTNMVKCKEMQ